jgi:hypothetical protein
MDLPAAPFILQVSVEPGGTPDYAGEIPAIPRSRSDRSSSIRE